MNHVRDFAAGSIGISDPKCGCWLEMDKGAQRHEAAWSRVANSFYATPALLFQICRRSRAA
jgi:hypothetical protein